MKIFLLSFILLTNIHPFLAQKVETVRVTYSQKETVDPEDITVNTDNPQDIKKQQQQMADELNALTYYFMLKVQGDESTFEFIPQIDNSQNGSNWVYGKEGEILYINTTDKISLETTSNPKKYIIVDSLKNLDWKMTREKKTICGIQTKQALFQPNDSTKIEAWFAPKIPSKAGPEKFFGLPGLILELHNLSYDKYGKINQSYYCNQLEIVNAAPIKAPTKGEKISKKRIR